MIEDLDNQNLVAAFSTGTDRTKYKAISKEEAELLGFVYTGKVVGVKVTPDSAYELKIPLWAEPE